MSPDYALLFEILERIKLDDTVEWKLPRERSRHQELTITGVLLAGQCTNRVIGEALSMNYNIIMTSNYQSNYDSMTNRSLWEVSYKHDIFILEWDMTWLFSTIQGQTVLAKLFLSDIAKLATERQQVISIEYSTGTRLRHVLQQFTTALGLKKQQDELARQMVERILIIPEWNDQIIETLEQDEFSDTAIITFTIPNRYLTAIMDTGQSILWVEPRDLLNAVSRELYYIIKQTDDIQVDYTANRIIKLEKISGLDGI